MLTKVRYFVDAFAAAFSLTSGFLVISSQTTNPWIYSYNELPGLDHFSVGLPPQLLHFKLSN